VQEIARASPDDSSDVAALINRAYEVERFFVLGDRTSAARVRAAMATGAFLIHRDPAGRVDGCVFVESDGTSGTFGMLAVDPAGQRQGLGARLIEAAEAYARTAGCARMSIRVVNLRRDLIPRYQRLGYVQVGEEPYDHRPTVQPCHFVVMTKALRIG
jgi:GNAT superfamily N-acetyltransferase